MRTRIYVDGFNLYYGALIGTQYKWLNPVELARQVLPLGCVVDRLRYFTAHISGFSDPNAPARQQVYINALKTLPEVRVHYGNFFQKTVRRPLINLPVADQRIETEPPVTLPEGNHLVSEIPERVLPVRRPGKRRGRNSVVVPNGVFAVYHTAEEKGSDVNLATHLLNDAWNDLFDLAAVISTDTDLVTPIRMVKEERNKPVSIVCPRRKVRKELTSAASSTYHIFSEHLSRAQFPEFLTDTISKPEFW